MGFGVITNAQTLAIRLFSGGEPVSAGLFRQFWAFPLPLAG